MVRWEQDNQERFGEGLPWRWVEIGEVLCEVAEDDLGGGGPVGGEGDLRVLLRTLREVRWSKAREGLKQLEST